MIAMRIVLAILVVVATAPVGGQQDTTVYLTLDQAPARLFPGAQIEPKEVISTHEFQEKLEAKLGRVKPTVWEQKYVTFTARQGKDPVEAEISTNRETWRGRASNTAEGASISKLIETGHTDVTVTFYEDGKAYATGTFTVD